MSRQTAQRIILTIIFIAVGFAALDCTAETALEDSVTRTMWLNEITVVSPHPERNAFTVLEIPRERIESGTAASVDQLLQCFPGLQVTTGRKNSAELSLRGSNRQAQLILVDGRPLNTGYFGSADLSLLPLDRIEKISVIKGPASVAYGANNSGGIVNIVTRDGIDQPLQVSVETKWSDYCERENRASTGGSLGSTSGWVSFEEIERQSTPMSSSFVHTETEDGNRRDNSDSKRISANAKVVHQLSQNRIVSFSVNSSTGKKGVPGSIYQTQYWRYTSIQRNGGTIAYQETFPPSLCVQSAVFINSYNDRLASYLTKDFSYSAIEYDSKMENLTYGGDIDVKWQTSPSLQFNSGFKLRTDFSKRRDVDKNEPWTDFSTSIGSLFSEHRWNVHKNWILTTGMALHSFRKWDNPLQKWYPAPMISVVGKVSSDYVLRAGVSRVFTFPTMHELFSRNRGNTELRPEVTVKLETSLERQWKLSEQQTLFVQAVTFRQHMQDQIHENRNGVFTNSSRISSWGWEINLAWELQRRIRCTSYATMLDWVTDDCTELIEQPHYSIGSHIQYRSPWRSVLELDWSYHDYRFGLNPTGNTVRMNSYAIVNCAVAQRISPNIELRASGRNIFDIDYEESFGYPAPGRTIFIGLRVTSILQEKE